MTDRDTDTLDTLALFAYCIKVGLFRPGIDPQLNASKRIAYARCVSCIASMLIEGLDHG